MRIISKFKDFYDSALTYGIDTSIVYERLTDDNIGIGSRCYYLRRDLETRLRHWDYTTTLDTLIIADKFYHRVTLITRYHPYMVVSACTSTDLEKFTRDVGGGKFHESTLKMIEDYLKALKEVREAHRKIPILYILVRIRKQILQSLNCTGTNPSTRIKSFRTFRCTLEICRIQWWKFKTIKSNVISTASTHNHLSIGEIL